MALHIDPNKADFRRREVHIGHRWVQRNHRDADDGAVGLIDRAWTGLRSGADAVVANVVLATWSSARTTTLTLPPAPG